MALFQNFLHSCRRHKTSTILNILGLSVAFTTFYILMIQVSFEWGFDSFHKDADRIYRVEVMRESDRLTTTCSFPVLSQLISSSPQIEAGAIRTMLRYGHIMLPSDSTGEKYLFSHFCYVTKGYTDVFTFDMVEGSTDSLRSPEYAIIPLSLAEKLYGKQQSYLNRIFGDNQSWFLRVAGVYRDFPKNSMIRNIVYQIPNESWQNSFINDWTNHNYYCYLKLSRHADPEHLLDNFKISDGYGPEKFHLRPLKDLYYSNIESDDIPLNGNRNINRLLFSIALFIIIIAGVNFMNFSMALVPSKIKGINTRLVLGASTLRLRLSLLFEAVLSAFIAFLLAMLTIYLISRTSFASELNGEINPFVRQGWVGFTLLIALATGFLSGLYPACFITSFPPARVINGSFALSTRGKTLRNALIGLQFTVSLTAIVIVLFMHLQNRFFQNEPPGFDKNQIINIFLSKKIRAEQPDAFVNRLKENPQIEEVAFIERAIGTGDSFMGWGRMTSKGDKIHFDVLPVTPDYLKVLGIQVTEGRDFRWEDEKGQKGVFIFNQTAKKRFNLELGDDIEGQGPIIGFMPDIKYQSCRNVVAPMAFYVWGTENWGLQSYTATIRVKADTDLQAATRYIGDVCEELDPHLLRQNIVPHAQLIETLYQKEQKQYTIISIFSFLIIFISVAGVFGLVIFETQARRKEVGIRKTFGSSEYEILALFNKTYLLIVLICSLIAIPAGYHATKIWLQNFAYHIPVYWWVAPVAIVIVLGIVAATVTLQSWRAARENPVDALNR